MGRNSGKGLAILGLIIGICGASLGAYSVFIMPSQAQTSTTTSSSRQYYDFYSYGINPGADGAFANNNNIEINFTVNPGETVYFSYVARANLDDSSTPNTYISFYFEVDGIRWSDPYQDFRRWNENDPDGANIRYGSIALQHYNTTMAAGHHIVKIAIYFYDSNDNVRQQSLFVQVFN